jgi:hypothetical protein
MAGLIERMVGEGDEYYQARRSFNILLSEHADAMYFTTKFIGGVYMHRDHKDDPDARPPFVVVEREKQREAMTLLEEQVFGVESYQFPRELYNYLAPSFWSHWGNERSIRLDYPAHEVILSWQDRVLQQLLASTTLYRLIDSEMKVPAKEEPFTAAEMLGRLTAAVFSELDGLNKGDVKYSTRQPAISSLRRNLQRRYLEHLSSLAMGSTSAPKDCRSIAYVELTALQARIKQVLAGKAQLDVYTQAHLTDASAVIEKVIESRMQLMRP